MRLAWPERLLHIWVQKAAHLWSNTSSSDTDRTALVLQPLQGSKACARPQPPKEDSARPRPECHSPAMCSPGAPCDADASSFTYPAFKLTLVGA